MRRMLIQRGKEGEGGGAAISPGAIVGVLEPAMAQAGSHSQALQFSVSVKPLFRLGGFAGGGGRGQGGLSLCVERILPDL